MTLVKLNLDNKDKKPLLKHLNILLDRLTLEITKLDSVNETLNTAMARANGVNTLKELDDGSLNSAFKDVDVMQSSLGCAEEEINKIVEMATDLINNK